MELLSTTSISRRWSYLASAIEKVNASRSPRIATTASSNFPSGFAPPSVRCLPAEPEAEIPGREHHGGQKQRRHSRVEPTDEASHRVISFQNRTVTPPVTSALEKRFVTYGVQISGSQTIEASRLSLAMKR